MDWACDRREAGDKDGEGEDEAEAGCNECSSDSSILLRHACTRPIAAVGRPKAMRSHACR